MKAFDEIYGLYARRLFAFCLKYTKSKENAEEIMEDTFVWLWNNRSTLEEAESVKPLLFLRAKHYLINAYRKVINSPVYEDYMDYLDHHNSTAADSQLEYDDFVRQLNLMLANCPRRSRKSSDSPSWRCSTIRRLPRNSTIVNRPLRTSCRWV